MNVLTGRLVSFIPQIVSALLVATTYYWALEPTIDSATLANLQDRFRFNQEYFDVEKIAPRPLVSKRNVHPSLMRTQAWVSATGAAITVADIDRDGLFNDALLVDTRLNTLVITPLPGTGNRFPSFILEPSGNEINFDPLEMSPTGSVVHDFNEDGVTDILVHYWGRSPLLFWGVKSDKPFPDSNNDFKPMELLKDSRIWHTHACCLSDVDGNGHLDLLMGNFFADDVAVLADGGSPRLQGDLSGALNGGGPKLFLWNPSADSTNKFEDHSYAMEEHSARSWVLAIGAVDLDPSNNDWQHLPEIYIANDFGKDHLLHNRSKPLKPQFVSCEGSRGFFTPKSSVLGRDSYKGMGVDFADINQDASFDIYVSNISDDFALHEGHFMFVSTSDESALSRGEAPFRQESQQLGLSRSGWGWDCRIADFDNDAVPEAIQATGFVKGTINRWPELHALGTTNDQLISNPDFWPRFMPPSADISGHNINPFFVRAKSGRYHNVAKEIGMDAYWNTRGLALTDADADGLLDFVAANQWEPSVYFHNKSHTLGKNAYVGLKVILPYQQNAIQETRITPNSRDEVHGTPAIGTIAQLLVDGNVAQVQYVDGGCGHSGRRAPILHFGLGENTTSTFSVRLTWRDRSGAVRKEVLNVKPNSWHTVELGQGDPS
jgi:enediyne biosynthesis protein E4